LYTIRNMNEDSTINKNTAVNQEEGENFIDLDVVESTEDGDALPAKDVTKKLREEIKKLQKEKEEYLTGWQRAKADYINLQKELDIARVNVSLLTKEKMVEKLLPALDSFEIAFNNKEHWNTLEKEWREGIESIHSQLMSGLSDSGIEKISEINVPFDPNIHQSISVVETNQKDQDHTVENILQVGYKIKDFSTEKAGRVIRPAKVTIYEYKDQ